MSKSNAEMRIRMERDLTKESVWKTLVRFSVPYLLSCFLQSFYGLADLFITGRYNGADAISAVSIGSQIMHMLTVILVGLAMGTTVTISRFVGAGKEKETAKGIGNTVSLFLLAALLLTGVLLLNVNGIIRVLSTPAEAVSQTKSYLIVCFLGVPCITAYNVISSIFRGMGDSKTPMYIVAVAGIINIFLDYLLIGVCGMAAMGAALGTIIAQAVSVISAFLVLRKRNQGISLCLQDLYFERSTISAILKVGVPIALQDGFIQVAFLIITAIANGRGVIAAAGVGIAEKIISFLFLVPSAMLSSVSAITAQNAGAGKHERGVAVLRYGIGISVVFGLIVTAAFQYGAEQFFAPFAKEEAAVIAMGSQYIRAYVWDCVFAGIHFCFSGYFCAYGKSFLSFIQNLVSIILIRIPGAYLASMLFPDTLYPMGLAAPAGSLLSAAICMVFFFCLHKKWIMPLTPTGDS